MKEMISKWLGLDTLFRVAKSHAERLPAFENRLHDVEVRMSFAPPPPPPRQTGNIQMQEFTTFTLSKGGKFEIVKLSTGQFLVGQGFETEAAAIEAAKGLCIKYPAEEFGIYAVSKRLRADIPIVIVDEATKAENNQ